MEAGPPPTPPPRWRELRWLVLCPPERLTEEQGDRLKVLLELNPMLKLAYDLTHRFRKMLSERRVEDLGPWLGAAARSKPPAFQRLSRTMTEDIHAIRAAVQQPWSTGPVEGHIHRLKLLKRLGYGRSSLPLLRARVIGE